MENAAAMRIGGPMSIRLSQCLNQKKYLWFKYKLCLIKISEYGNAEIYRFNDRF